MAVHHTNKSGTMRGSSVLFGAANTVLRCDRDKITGDRSIFAEKVKDGREGPLFSYRLEPLQLSARSDLTPITSCTVVETMPHDAAAALFYDLLQLVKSGPTSVNGAADHLSQMPAHSGDSKSKLARRLIDTFRAAHGSISAAGQTIALDPRGDAGGKIMLVSNN
jgi:hypothetical protein